MKTVEILYASPSNDWHQEMKVAMMMTMAGYLTCL